MEEVWKDLPNSNGVFQVSNTGKVRTTRGFKRHGKIIKPYIRCGRLVVDNANVKSICNRIDVADAVATLFLQQKKWCVKAVTINGDAKNCCIDNLQWDIDLVKRIENEVWTEVNNTNGKYLISNLGRVLSRARIVKLHSQELRKGYYSVSICGKHRSVHRLVAEHFVPNPKNKPEVDHIDGNPLNNVAENLRWVTRQENELNPITRTRISNSLKGRIISKEARIKTSRTIFRKSDISVTDQSKVRQYSLQGKLIKSWDTVSEVARRLGLHAGTIQLCIRGKMKTTGGYRWSIS